MKTAMKWCVFFILCEGFLELAVAADLVAATQIVIRGTDQVVDGWVRTAGQPRLPLRP